MTGDKSVARIAFIAVLFLVPGFGHEARAAAPMNQAAYEAAMTELDDTARNMAEATAALDAAHTREDAGAQAATLGTRLDRLRALMVDAAKRDRIGAKGMATPERQRARCAIARAGALEDPLQDLWTIWSMRARGDPGTERFGLKAGPGRKAANIGPCP